MVDDSNVCRILACTALTRSLQAMMIEILATRQQSQTQLFLQAEANTEVEDDIASVSSGLSIVEVIDLCSDTKGELDIWAPD